MTFRTPIRSTLWMFKAAIEEEIWGGIVVFQDLGNGDYLLECERNEGAKVLVEQSFDIEEMLVSVHPRRGKYINVSLLALDHIAKVRG